MFKSFLSLLAGHASY